MESRCIAHVDMDAFYVSVELQRRPELLGQPVVVAGSGPRSVVTTASYEARRFGIFSATPAARARRLCPQAIFIPPDFETYRTRSGQVMQVLRRYVDRVEVVGLDEAYLDLTGYEHPLETARQVKAAIHDDTGLGCSVGIGPSKLVAKVASDADKPDGFLALTQEEARVRFAEASPKLIPGIGPKTAAWLAERGVTTLGKLAATPGDVLVEWFGLRLGPHLGRLARFEDEREVETWRPAKAESRETTFDRDLRRMEDLEEVLGDLAADLCEGLADGGRRGRTISIKIRLNDFSTHTRDRTLPEATNDPDVVLAVARELLHEFAPARPVRLLGVRVSRLDEPARAASDGPPGQLELPPWVVSGDQPL
jgi:DNA polymerase-4